MREFIPKCPIFSNHEIVSKKQEIKVFRIKTITPLVGGGVDTFSHDKVTPIRSSSIKGHLRFWWRATIGARLESIQMLKERENQIWGSTEIPSKVKISVKLITPISNNLILNPANNYGFPRFGSESYALFSAIQNNSSILSSGIEFELKLAFSNQMPISVKNEILTAVWAWVNFGGIGARTRRGCGALFCNELSPNVNKLEEVSDTLANKISEFGTIKLELSSLNGMIFLRDNPRTALDAWRCSIGLLKDFRQGEGIGRNYRPNQAKAIGGNNRPGRSRWPEPDAVRRYADTHNVHHPPRLPNDFFPRAEFGLPLIIHFIGQDEPNDATIKPIGKERMSSPLIIKPLAIGDHMALPMVVKLTTPELTEIEIQPFNRRLNSTGVINPNLAKYPNSPLFGNTGSAIAAFLDLAVHNGFRGIIA